MANGLWFKLRQAYPSPIGIFQAFRRTSTVGERSSHEGTPKDARIVILGLGPAALSCAMELSKIGYSDVRFVSKDAMFGGKCVNFGCMPSEFVFSVAHLAADERVTALDEFIVGLRSDVKEQFTALGMPVIQAEVQSIRGTFLQVATGDPIAFDLLIVATGNRYTAPHRVPLNTTKVVSIEDVWRLKAGNHLVIYAKDNPAALPIAEAAFALGLNVTLIMAGVSPFASLPSWKYLTRSAVRRGIEVLDQDVRLIRVDEQGISFERGSKISTIPYDHLLVASKPEPSLVEIDGHVPSALDVNLTTGAVPGRSNIYLVGDAAGFLTAAEAEEHSRLVTRWIALGSPVDIEALGDIPMSFHGPSPLAMVGKPWTWNVPAKRWIEIDFRQIGWTKVHGHEGKLWYLPGKMDGHVDAIHICHPLANELIAIARHLLVRPISDSAWRMATVHPSAAEIFKLVH